MHLSLPLLSDAEHTSLIRLICDGNTPLSVRERAAVLLLSHGGQNRHEEPMSVREVAEKMACSACLVASTRRRFADGGMQAALGSPVEGVASATAA